MPSVVSAAALFNKTRLAMQTLSYLCLVCLAHGLACIALEFIALPSYSYS